MTTPTDFSWWCRFRGHHIITVYKGPSWIDGQHTRRGCHRCAHLPRPSVQAKQVKP